MALLWWTPSPNIIYIIQLEQILSSAASQPYEPKVFSLGVGFGQPAAESRLVHLLIPLLPGY